MLCNKNKISMLCVTFTGLALETFSFIAFLRENIVVSLVASPFRVRFWLNIPSSGFWLPPHEVASESDDAATWEKGREVGSLLAGRWLDCILVLV